MFVVLSPSSSQSPTKYESESLCPTQVVVDINESKCDTRGQGDLMRQYMLGKWTDKVLDIRSNLDDTFVIVLEIKKPIIDRNRIKAIALS